jgi:hypothetical protein
MSMPADGSRVDSFIQFSKPLAKPRGFQLFADFLKKEDDEMFWKDPGDIQVFLFPQVPPWGNYIPRHPGVLGFNPGVLAILSLCKEMSRMRYEYFRVSRGIPWGIPIIGAKIV